MSAPPFAPDGASTAQMASEGAPPELVVELDADGMVRAVERPEWVGEAGPRVGEPITRSLALELGSLTTTLERTARSAGSEPIMARLVGAGELRPVTGRVTPLPRLPARRPDSAQNRPDREPTADDADAGGGKAPIRGWLLALRPDTDLPARLLAAAPHVLIQAVEQMSVGLTLTDRAGRIVFANRAEAAMHGYEPEELIGMPSRLLGVTGDARPPSPAALVNTPWGRQRLNRRRGGDVFPVRLVSDDVRGESGRVLGRITVCEDVTERARLDRMQEEFVTVVSHELRTPLTSILGCLALLRNDQSPPERFAEALAIAERNGRLLLTLVSDLLDLERAVSGALEIDLTAVPVAGVLREAARRAEGSAGQAGSESAPSRIVIDLDGLDRAPGATEATVRADRERLLQALGHLLSNALKFSPAGSPVFLVARRSPDHTTLVVADQGPGIPEAFRARSFEPFLQADASRTRPAAGTGLGLALARALTERMGGRLDLADDPAGGPTNRGTTLHLRLPNG